MERIQVENRICGTTLRLGWFIGIATYVPIIFYLVCEGTKFAQLMYTGVLALVALFSFFLLLANENFRNAFKADFTSKILPLAQKVYQIYTVVFPMLFVAGIIFAVTSLILSIKEKNGKVSYRRIISSIVLIIFLIISLIIFYITKSKIAEAAL